MAGDRHCGHAAPNPQVCEPRKRHSPALCESIMTAAAALLQCSFSTGLMDVEP